MNEFVFKDLLFEVSERFPADVRWAVTCGSALTLHGLPYHPSDLDFFAPADDAYRIAERLSEFPTVFPVQLRSSGIFRSHFGRFRIDDVEVDVVGDFSIEWKGHRYDWNAEHPCWDHIELVRFNLREIPVFSLEDLLVIYLGLPDEDAKVDLITEELQRRGVDRDYLNQLLGPNSRVDDRVEGLMG